jgi:hypothetical protein
MKKINKTWLLFIFLTLFASVKIYSQEKNAVFTTMENFVLFPIGIGYERMINEYFSFDASATFTYLAAVVADADYDADVLMNFCFLAHIRFFPFKTSMKKFFWDIGTGYRHAIKKTNVTETYYLFPIQTRIGWKFCIKRFFIQPWIGYNKDFGRKHFLDEELFKYGYPALGLSLGFSF